MNNEFWYWYWFLMILIVVSAAGLGLLIGYIIGLRAGVEMFLEDVDDSLLDAEEIK